MKMFMGNSCGNGYCMSAECEQCKCYSPTIFGKNVPKWIGNIGFIIEAFILKMKISFMDR
jgi:hypothetical protein